MTSQDHGAGDYRPSWIKRLSGLTGRSRKEGRDSARPISSNVPFRLVELLGKLPQSAIRTHYIQQVSERLVVVRDAWLFSWRRICASRCRPALAWPLSLHEKWQKRVSESAVKRKSCGLRYCPHTAVHRQE